MIPEEPVRVGIRPFAREAPPRKPRKRKRVPVDPFVHEELFVLLTTLRAANAKSLYELFFKRRNIPWRTAMRRLHQLVSEGYLGHLRLDGARCVYHLKTPALSTSARLRSRSVSSTTDPPPEQQAMYCWLRSTMWASLSEAGYSVGQTANELRALRRYMLDTMTASLAAMDSASRFSAQRSLEFMRKSDELGVPVCLACSSCSWRGPHRKPHPCPSCKAMATAPAYVQWSYRCRSCDAKLLLPTNATHARGGDARIQCGGELREVGVVPYDIAWRKRGHAYEVMVLFVDNPSRSLEAQVEELPFLCHDSPRLPMILRSVDSRARFDRAAMKWVSVGPRHAELMKTFTDPLKRAHQVTVVDHRPEIQAYYAQ